MLIAIAGSSGLIGSALAASIEAHGHTVRRLRRDALSPESLMGADAVVNLAGENLAQRWTDGVRRRIRDSRIRTTTQLAESIARMARRPRVFVSGSAIGIYGSRRGDAVLDESSTHGDDFLARVCEEWEASARAASDAGVRVVYIRTGLVLAAHGGALAKLLLPFRLGVGGRIGSGDQWMSWISLEDEVRAIEHVIANEWSGAANLVAPNPVTNAEFTSALGHALHRPTFLPVPAAALELAMGDMARDTILASQRVMPKRLLESGFEFESPTLSEGLRAALSGSR
jgi:uncharacterized protein (TIGR01777 family)